MKKNLEIKNYTYIPTTYILYAGIMNYILAWYKYLTW